MKSSKIIRLSSTIFIGLSALSLLYVSMLSIFNPQATMNLVHVTLDNTDAISSIRGVYGSTGLAIMIAMVWVYFKEPKWSLSFLALFWGGYAISRFITIIVDGHLGDFGNQWIVIESLFCCIALLLNKFYPITDTSNI